MRKLLCLLLIALCGACIQLGGEPQPQHFFLLSPLAQTDPQPGPEIRLQLSELGFPSYLDRPQIVSRNDQGQLVIAASDRWGEPLQENLQRVVKENLQRRINGLLISDYPWQPREVEGLRLKMTILQLDGVLGRTCRIDIRWSLTSLKDRRFLVSRHFEYQAAIGTGAADLVAGLNQGISQLTTQMAEAIKTAAAGQ